MTSRRSDSSARRSCQRWRTCERADTRLTTGSQGLAKLRGREDPRPRPLPSPGENNARTVRSARSVHGHPRPSTANELSRSRWTVPRALTDRPNALQRRRCRDRELTKANGSATTPPGQRPINGAVTGAYWSLGDEHRAAQRGQGQGQLALDRLHGTARHGVGVRLVAVAGGQLDGDLARRAPSSTPFNIFLGCKSR